ncbi:MAG: sigma 54-interacting transcriptional regulator [Ilumatobacteraceae bacterium]
MGAARRRFAEKLATPDTSIADLIGEIDPIKVAEGRYLSDELALHYGLVPRANRGIFAINELPDLPERIQVGLLNVLEERDVQIRSSMVRLELDVWLVASANPEDYTNRGRIITPLKDRFGSQIRTHYPLEVPTEVDIIRSEARAIELPDASVSVPDYLVDVVATFSHLARASSHVNQRSGVSVRLSVSNYEALAANALRRGLRGGERDVVARVDDLGALAASTSGKIEIESFDEGRDGAIIENLLSGAVLAVFREARPGRDADVDHRLVRRGHGRAHRRARRVARDRLIARADRRAADARRHAHGRRRVARRRRQCRRVRSRRAPPVEAAEQGLRRRPFHVSLALRRCRSRSGRRRPARPTGIVATTWSHARLRSSLTASSSEPGSPDWRRCSASVRAS